MAENENEIPGILELVRVARKTGSELLIRQYRSSTGSTKDYQVQLLGPSGYGDLLLETEQYLKDIIAGGNANLQLLLPGEGDVGSVTARVKYDEAVAYAKEWLKELEDRRLIPGTTGASNSFIPEAPGECNLYRNAKGELMLRNLRNMQALPAPTPEELTAMTGKQLVQRYAPTTTYGQMFRMLTTHCEAVQLCMEVAPAPTTPPVEDIPEWIVDAIPVGSLVAVVWDAFVPLALRTAPDGSRLLDCWTNAAEHSLTFGKDGHNEEPKWDGTCHLMHGLIGMMSEMDEVARCTSIPEKEEELADVLWYAAMVWSGHGKLKSCASEEAWRKGLQELKYSVSNGTDWEALAYATVDTGKRVLFYNRPDLLPLLGIQLFGLLACMERALQQGGMAPPYVICRRVIHKLAKRYPAGFSVEAARQRADKDEATDDVQR